MLLPGTSKDRIVHALEHIRVNGRMEIVHTSSRCTVLVDYAHNAVSMESLLTTPAPVSSQAAGGGIWMRRQPFQDRRYSMGEIGGRLADLSIITADNSRYEKVEDIMADIRGSIEKQEGTLLKFLTEGTQSAAASFMRSRGYDSCHRQRT